MPEASFRHTGIIAASLGLPAEKWYHIDWLEEHGQGKEQITPDKINKWNDHEEARLLADFFFPWKGFFSALIWEFAINWCAIFAWNHVTWQVLNRTIPGLLPCEWYILPVISKAFLVETIDLYQVLNSTQQEKRKCILYLILDHMLQHTSFVKLISRLRFPKLGIV